MRVGLRGTLGGGGGGECGEVGVEAVDGAARRGFGRDPDGAALEVRARAERHPPRPGAELEDARGGGEAREVAARTAEVVEERERRGPHAAAAVLRL